MTGETNPNPDRERNQTFVDAEVTFESGSAGLELAGTLTLPNGKGNRPAAVLIHGQGPLDRDMSLAHLKPFKRIAEWLASKGIATLRYDKRGVGRSTGDFDSAGRQDLAEDVRAAINYLKNQEAVDSSKIGLLGQSEGGLIAPAVAANVPDVAFLVLLAGPALPGRDNAARSFAAFAQASSANELSFDDLKAQLDRLLGLAGEKARSPEEEAEIRRLADSLVPHIVNDKTRLILGGANISVEQFLGMLQSPCLTETFESVPAEYLTKLSCPVLALFAEKDKHVLPQENKAALEAALSRSETTDYTVVEVPGANHLFQTCKTGFPDEYLTIDHDISPDVLETIGGWILERMYQ